jgi:hypothetical protein
VPQKDFVIGDGIHGQPPCYAAKRCLSS